MISVVHTTQATGVNDPSKQISKDAWNEAHEVTGLSTVAESGLFADLLSKPTTLAGYGITDGATDAEVTAAISAHEAAADPHPGYLTAAEGNAAYQPLDTQLTSLAGLSYSGNSLKVARVNSGETGFELASLTTSIVSEGSNLYFTDERAQDAVGTILTDSATIDFTYNDAGNTITASVITTGLSLFNSTDSGVVPGSGGGTSNFLRADGSWAAPTASAADSDTPETGSRTVATGKYHVTGERYQLTSTQRLTLAGTGRIRIQN